MGSDLTHSTGVSNPMVLIQAAIEKGLVPEQLGKLMDLQERWERNQAAKAFAEAIKGFQAKMPAVVKGNPVRDKAGKLMYTFASLDDIMAVAQPILDEFGIVVTFSTKLTTDKLMETTCNVRVGIHVEHTSITLSLPNIPNANDAQKAGAAVAYGQRYAMKAALNIRIKGEDNDAQGLEDQYLLPDQIDAIEKLLDDYKESRGKAIDLKRFLNFCGVKEGGEVKDMLTSRFEEAVATLKAKIAEGRK